MKLIQLYKYLQLKNQVTKPINVILDVGSHDALPLIVT